MIDAMRARPDEGFTLVEVLVAILIVGAMLLVLLGVSTGALAVQETARRQQVAAGIANEVMERIRSLGYSDIQAGIGDGAAAWDTTHVRSCPDGQRRLVRCPGAGSAGSDDGLGEIVVTSSASTVNYCPPAVSTGTLYLNGANPALPLRPSNCTLYKLNGVEYRAYAYVTSRTAKNVTRKDSPYRITVIVEWEDHGELRSTRLQTMAWAPVGCSGSITKDLVGGPCGWRRDTSYGFSGQMSVYVAFCKDVPSCKTQTPSLEIDLGYLTLNWVEDSGDVSLKGSVTGAEVTTTSPSGATTVNLVTAAPGASADQVNADNLQATATTETAGPQYPGRGVASAVVATSASFECLTCAGVTGSDDYRNLRGPWELRADLVGFPSTGSCGLAAPLSCGTLEANASETGLCASVVVAAPCVVGSLGFASIRVLLCKANGGVCLPPIAVVGGGAMAGSLTDGGNAISMLGASAWVADLGVLGGTGWLVGGTYDGSAKNAVKQGTEPQIQRAETTLYYGMSSASQACVNVNGWSSKEVSSPQPCFFKPEDGVLWGNAPRSKVLQLQGFAKSNGKVSANWFYGEYDGSGDGNGGCYDQITKGSNIFTPPPDGQGGGSNTKYTACPQLAPALVLTVSFPSISASDSATASTGRWYGW